MEWFLTGTDTDAGKTYISTLILKHLQSLGQTAIGYKPVCSGGRADAHFLLEASSPGATLDEVNPCWYHTPLSPMMAAQFENRPVVLETLVAGFEALRGKSDHLLVEGAGGWLTPLAPGQTMADLAVALKLPVLLVINNRLGAINHALLTLESIAAKGLTCVGIILNYPKDERDPASISNRAALARFTDIPILAEVLHGADDLSLESSLLEDTPY